MLDYHTQGQAGSNYLGVQHHTHPCCQDTQPRDHFSKVKTGVFAVLEPKDGILRHTRMREAKAALTQKHTKPSMVIGQPGSTATQPPVVHPPHTHTHYSTTAAQKQVATAAKPQPHHFRSLSTPSSSPFLLSSAPPAIPYKARSKSEGAGNERG
jgi:hypothetical protein